VKRILTPAQLTVGDPIENSVGMVLVPIPGDEFLVEARNRAGQKGHRGATLSNSDETVLAWRAGGNTGPMASGDGHDAVEG